MTKPPPAPPLLRDSRKLLLGTADEQAAQHVEEALRRMMAFDADPLTELGSAHDADPQWLLPLVMRAGHLLSLRDHGHDHEIGLLLEQAQALSQDAVDRERIHLAAVSALAEGRWHHACRLWDELLLDQPRDALALLWAHEWDLVRGDTVQLRQRPAQSLPEWDEADPLYPYALGLYAFGLQENNLFPLAEDMGHRATTAPGRPVPWAVHAVAHVMEMQGRCEDGAAWLRHHQPGWAEGSLLAGHLWWHMGLFRLEAMDMPGAQRLVDAHFSRPSLNSALRRMDAASLLWRMHLLGMDVQACFAQLVDAWPLGKEEAGWHAFHDVHGVLALLGAGEPGRAEQWLGRCAARAFEPEDVRRSNHLPAREVGLPLMRGLLAFARGEFAQALAALHALRPQAWRLGGSQAQRDLIDQTLLAAAAHLGGHPVGRALLNERRLARALTPLTRHWAQLLHIEL